MIEETSPDKVDIMAIQEPHIDFLGRSRGGDAWRMVYPDRHTVERAATRSVILVSNRIASNAWFRIPVDSSDITAIMIVAPDCNIALFNIYNDGNHSESLDRLREALEMVRRRSRRRTRFVVLGDFNRHHPMWDEERNAHLFTRHNLDEAQNLIDLTTDWRLEMALPKDIPTLEAMRTKNLTRPDNVFMSKELIDRLVYCNTKPEERALRTDHFPILTTLDVSTARAPLRTIRNFKQVKWEDFRKTVERKLPEWKRPRDPSNPGEFERLRSQFTEALQEAIDQHAPANKLSHYSRRWWTEELKEWRKVVKHLQRRSWQARAEPDDTIHTIYRRTRNEYGRLVEATKKGYWEKYLATLSDSNVWTAHRVTAREPTDGSRARIPNLTERIAGGQARELTTDEEKGKALIKEFFARSPNTDWEQEDYPPPQFKFKAISDHQVEEAIKKLKAHKCPGEDGITNMVLINCAEIVVPTLGALFRASFRLEYMPEAWKDTKTVVLRKPGKADYSIPKAYRPVEIASGIRRLFGAVVARELTLQAEKHQLLPDTQFGGRPGRSTVDAIHLLTKSVRDAWRKGKVMGAIFLDIKGAFPHVNLQRLTYDMRMAGVPRQWADWFGRLGERKTRLTFDDYSSDPVTIETGLMQGCPSSVIAFLFYHAGLSRVTEESEGERSVAFVDDLTYTVIGDSMTEVNQKLTDIMVRRGGALEWGRTHDSTFELDKSAHMIWTKRRERVPQEIGAMRGRKTRPVTRPRLEIAGLTIPTVSVQRLLGVLLEQELSPGPQAAKAVATGTKWMQAVRRLANVSKGIPPKYMRRFYITVALPKMLYAASTFLKPMEEEKPRMSRALRQMARVQRQAALQITGAMRTSATDVTEAHAHLIPFHLAVNRQLHSEALRIATLPKTHPLFTHIREAAAKPQLKRHPSQLHLLCAKFKLEPDWIETIPAFRHSSGWKPDVKVVITADKEQALEEARAARERIQVYTDGSVIDGGVGAAADLWIGRSRDLEVRRHLGEGRHFTIFEAELMAIAIALGILIRRRIDEPVMIGVDSQAAIKALLHRRPGVAGYLADAIHRRVAEARSKHAGLEITLRWVPAHQGMLRNELIDKGAKAAARGESTEQTFLTKKLENPPISVAAIRKEFKEDTANWAARTLRKSVRGQRLQRLDPRMPSGAFLRTTMGLGRKATAILTQLRTGHLPLNAHLHRIGKAESPGCEACGYRQETALHYLALCPAYEELRVPLKRKLRGRATELRSLLANTNVLPLLLRFIAASKRFERVYGELRVPDRATHRVDHSARPCR
jgi:ribonuclease HI